MSLAEHFGQQAGQSKRAADERVSEHGFSPYWIHLLTRYFWRLHHAPEPFHIPSPRSVPAWARPKPGDPDSQHDDPDDSTHAKRDDKDDKDDKDDDDDRDDEDDDSRDD